MEKETSKAMRKATDRPIVIAIGIRWTCEWIYGYESQ